MRDELVSFGVRRQVGLATRCACLSSLHSLWPSSADLLSQNPCRGLRKPKTPAREDPQVEVARPIPYAVELMRSEFLRYRAPKLRGLDGLCRSATMDLGPGICRACAPRS